MHHGSQKTPETSLGTCQMLKVLIFILFAIGKHCNRNQQLSDSKQANPPIGLKTEPPYT